MKRIIFVFVATMLSFTVCNAAMSNSRLRKETRFLTDKMAYELNLSTEQYNDVYEINYDFIAGVRYLMNDVLRGEEWALDRYYDYLDMRNDDLRWVLSNRQYARFMQTSYFYRPIYVDNGRWAFRVYVTYSNHNHYYFPQPYHYRTYRGGHGRAHYDNSYYRGRYRHPYYTGTWSIRNDKSYHANRRSDFESVNVRSNSGRRSADRDDVYTTRRSSREINTDTRRDSANDRNMDMRRNNGNDKNSNVRRSDGDERRSTVRRSADELRNNDIRRSNNNSRESIDNNSNRSRRRSAENATDENNSGHVRRSR